MDVDQKKLVRTIVRRVHPDLFAAHPAERAANAASLQALNAYADLLAAGQRPEPVRLDFFARADGGALEPVAAELPGHGSLAPLFFAFGLISAEELAAAAGAGAGERDGRDLFQWLGGVAAEAAQAAGAHDALKRAARALRAELEAAHGLAAVDAGGEFAVAGEEQRRQLEALRALAEALAEGAATGALPRGALEGLRLRVYHPDSAPLTAVGRANADGSFDLRAEPLGGRVADDGVLHVVAARGGGVAAALGALDLARARVLARAAAYWAARARDLAPALRDALGVQNVWCDARQGDLAQRFALWAGALLEARAAEAPPAPRGRAFSFSLLVHADPASPMLDFAAASSVLQVRCDCPPRQLLAYMAGEGGALADRAAAAVTDARAEEEEALAAVRDALGARAVVRVCSSHDAGRVVEAARRLVDAAPAIRAAVDLAGVSLAIDDVYGVWDAGFISIPYDFSLADLQPQLQALLTSPASAGAASGGGGSPGEPAPRGAASAAARQTPPRLRAPPPPRRAAGWARAACARSSAPRAPPAGRAYRAL
jgi:hypothetical protein